MLKSKFRRQIAAVLNEAGLQMFNFSERINVYLKSYYYIFTKLPLQNSWGVKMEWS